MMNEIVIAKVIIVVFLVGWAGLLVVSAVKLLIFLF